MAMHTAHPDSHDFGLADNCPRCDEHAEHPFDSLDDSNFSNLVQRVVDPALGPRSTNERRAMIQIKEVMNKYSRIEWVYRNV